MALVSIFNKGKIEDIETTLKKYRHLPRPTAGLLTSFTNRGKAIALGISLTVFGVACVYLLITARLNLYQRIMFICGSLACVVGPYILFKASLTLKKEARPHDFFYYDEARVILGRTGPVDQTQVDKILKMPVPERISALTAVSPGFTEIPLQAIDSLGLRISKAALDINKMTIRSGRDEILVDFPKILPSVDFSGIKSATAFNAISQFYTQAVGKTIPASIENP
jgi:hypothetical protein